MSSDYTRRDVLVGAGSLLAAAGVASALGSGRAAPYVAAGTDAALVDGERETVYPLVTYNDHGGPYAPTMPVNVRFDLTGTDGDVAAVEGRLEASPVWTGLLADLDAQWPFGSIDRPAVWDGAAGRLRMPVGSYRSLVSPAGPTVGYHVHYWPVYADGALVGVAASAHTDVGDALDHVGARYEEAADRLSAPFVEAGWESSPATFEYGVDAGQRSHWGATGDRWLRPPPDW